MSHLRSRLARLERAGSDRTPIVCVLTRGRSRREANAAALADAGRQAAERGVALVVVSLPPSPPPAPPGGAADLTTHLATAHRPRAPEVPPGTVPS